MKGERTGEMEGERASTRAQQRGKAGSPAHKHEEGAEEHGESKRMLSEALSGRLIIMRWRRTLMGEKEDVKRTGE